MDAQNVFKTGEKNLNGCGCDDGEEESGIESEEGRVR